MGARLMKKMQEFKSKIEQHRLVLLSVGLGALTGFLFSLIFEPFLQFILYRSMDLAIVVLFWAVAIIIIAFIVYFEAGSNIQFSRRRVFQLFILGISVTSFILAGINFLTYPDVIFSSGANWILKGGPDWVIGGIPFSKILFFVAKTLWSIFIGSLFTFLSRFLTILSEHRND